MEGLLQLLPFLGILLVFWFLIIRPARRRQREQGGMQSALAGGDRVVLTSGIFGTLTAVHDDRVDVEIAAGTVITVARGAIGALVPDQAGDDGHDPGRPTLDKHTTDAEASKAPDAPEGGEN